MRILVTGAAGFIGSHAVDFLQDRGHEIICVDDFSTGKIENLKVGNRSIIVEADIRDTDSMNFIFDAYRPDAVLHLAAQSAITTAWNDPGKDLDVNGWGTLNILQMCVIYKVKKFVFASTAAVYGKGGYWASKEDDKCSPDTPYGISKLAAEHYIRLMFPNHVILRFGNVYGKRQSPIGENQVIARAIYHFERGDDFKVVGNGNQKRDFVNVQDIVHLIHLSLSSNKTGTFNASTGKSVSVNNVLSAIEDIYGVGGYAWGHTEENDPRGDVFMNSNKAYSELGWKADTALIDGIRDAVKYESSREGRK